MKAPAKLSGIHSGTGTLLVFHGRDTHAALGLARAFVVTCLAVLSLTSNTSVAVTRSLDTQWIHDIHFIAYSPSTSDPRPEHRRVPKPEEIQADLQTLRPCFDGLILYSASEPSDDILRLAKDMRFRGVVLGVWDVQSESELQTAVDPATRCPGLVKAICLGNEGLTFRRYTHEQLASAFVWMRKRLPAMPLATSEPIAQYGDTVLQELPDFHAPNIHPVFDYGRNDIEGAVAWVVERADAVREVTGKPVLCKETGWPSGGAARFTPEAQRAFWRLLQARIGRDPAPKVGFVYFEAFDLPWKASASGIPEEGHWGLWTAGREPKEVVREIPALSNGKEQM